MRVARFTPIVALALLAGCDRVNQPTAVKAPAEPTVASFASDKVRFSARADFAAFEKAEPIKCAPALSGPYEGVGYTIEADAYYGTGLATGMGKVDVLMVFDNCQTVLQGTGDAMVVFTVNGHARIDNARGDGLKASFYMVQHYGGAFELPNVTWTSGIGKYENMMGTSIGYGTIDRKTLAGSFSLLGLLEPVKFE